MQGTTRGFSFLFVMFLGILNTLIARFLGQGGDKRALDVFTIHIRHLSSNKVLDTQQNRLEAMTGKTGENEQKRLFEGSVNITIDDIPAYLLHEFGKRVIEPFYKGGISEAIKSLMQKAVQEQKQNEIFQKFPWKKDEERFNEAGALITLRRRYENYAIFNLGEKLAATFIDLAFRSPQTYPDAILVNLETEETMNVEFEEFSSDFKAHRHDPAKCDLIICWMHDWNKRWTNEKCPLAVFEVGSGEGEGTFHMKEQS